MLNERTRRILHPSYDTRTLQPDNLQDTLDHDGEEGNVVRTRGRVQRADNHANPQLHRGEAD